MNELYINEKQVREYLPQGPDFQWIDTAILKWDNIEDLLTYKIEAKYKVPSTNSILENHFPQQPLLPGVISLEIISQAASLMGYNLKKDNPNLLFLLTNIKNAKFKDKILPNDELTINVSMNKFTRNFFNMQGTISKNNKVVISSEVVGLLKL